jgi:hypothetical protein
MKYYSYNEYTPDDPNANLVITVSEEEILSAYWPYWSMKGMQKYGKEEFERVYSKQDCIDDWVVINWALESKGD